MVTTYEPRTATTVTTTPTPSRTRPRWFLIVAAVLAVVLAALGGYALAGGFSTSEGQHVADSVIQVWRTGNVADMNATYAPNVEVGGDGNTAMLSRAQLQANIQTGLRLSGATGENVIRQIGPVSEYRDGNGDLYVSTLVETYGVPYSAVYRVRDGKVIAQEYLSPRDYQPLK